MIKQFINITLSLCFFLGFVACNGNNSNEGKGTNDAGSSNAEAVSAEAAPSSPEAFTPESFQKLITENEIVVVDFKADWCGPCKMLGPILEKVSEEPEFKGKVKLQKIDVDQSPDLARSFNIQSIPYVVKYVKGKKVTEILGAVDENYVRNFFTQ